jgi:hypothetical protein
MWCQHGSSFWIWPHAPFLHWAASFALLLAALISLQLRRGAASCCGAIACSWLALVQLWWHCCGWETLDFSVVSFLQLSLGDPLFESLTTTCERTIFGLWNP